MTQSSDRTEGGPPDALDLQTRASILEEAIRITTGDRNNSYGPPTQDFDRAADILTALLGHKLTAGARITSYDIAAIQIAVKLSRLQWSPDKRDHWVDIAGYAGCGAECVENDRGGLR